jgi:hypothetical protein
MKPRAIPLIAILGALLVATAWAFPRVWYNRGGESNIIWLNESTNLAAWTFQSIPVSKVEESALDADATFSGEFLKARDRVNVFSAKRYSDDPNEIGLFVHTPDRCWVSAGWKLEPAAPDVTELEVAGLKIQAERRIFRWKSGERLLVYFYGLSAGQPLPYRLDHNLSIAYRQLMQSNSQVGAAQARASDKQFWGRVWDCFRDRRLRNGPKQFIRLATPISGSDIASADDRLKKILPQWLQATDFQKDLQTFEARSRRASSK